MPGKKSKTTPLHSRFTKWYGWLPDLPDHRDILYGAV